MNELRSKGFAGLAAASLLALAPVGAALAQPAGQFKSLSHNIHAVNDLDTTLAFYRDVFGFEGRALDFANPAVPLLTNAPGVTLRMSMLTLPGGTRYELTHFKGLERQPGMAKYTDPGGHIELAVEREREGVAIRVRDDGIGIDPAMLPRVFDMFAQVESSLERSQGGLGIGLTLVKRLVEMHGGTVTAHSEGRGKGTEVAVRLPIAGDRTDRPAEGAGESGNAAAVSRNGSLVLVVDDVLLEVEERAQPRDRERTERRTVANAIHEPRVAARLLLLHEQLEALLQRRDEDPARRGGMPLPDHQVGGEVLGGPPLAEGGSVRTELLEEVAQLPALAGVQRFRHGR